MRAWLPEERGDAMTIYRVYFRSISNPNGPSEYCDSARVEAAAEVLMHMKGAFLISTIEDKPGRAEPEELAGSA